MSDRSTTPRLRGLPLFGNLFEFRRSPPALLRRVLAECGEIGTFTLGPRAVTVIASAELARSVLVDDADAYEKGPVLRTFSRPILGEGLLSVENAKHRERRKIVAQAFGPRALAGYAKTMAEVAKQTVSSWDDGALIDVGEECTRLALRVVGRTLFSVDFAAEQSELSDAIAVVQRWVTAQISFPMPLFPSVRRAIRRLDAAVAELIARRRRGDGPDDDLLAALVRARDDAGNPVPDRQIRDEAMTLFLAGHETSANSIAWAFDLLMRHPDAMQRVREEALAVLGDRAPTAADVPSLDFTGRVFSEALRLYPQAHSFGRQASRAVRLGEYTLPKGAIVIVSTYLMHRRATYFPDPDRFDPDRFLLPTFPKFAYLPFGAGPRACIGGQFATIEAAISLATIVRAVDLSLVDPSPNDVEMLVTLRPKRPILARVSRPRRGEPRKR